MPIYEFRCDACGRNVSIFQRSMRTAVSARCDRCGSDRLTRLVSGFAFHRSASDTASAFDAEGGFDDETMMDMDGVDESDPRSMARWARRMGDRLGEDLPPDFDDMVSRMEAGEIPDDGDDSSDGDEFADDF